MKIIPRDYQNESVLTALKEKENTIIVLSTGAGKSVVISELIRQSKAKKVLIFQPTAEILKQNQEHFDNIIGTQSSILSASLNSHEIGNITFATIGTAINKVEELKNLNVDLILIDECIPWGTKIQTKNGEKEVQDLKIGDEVLSYNCDTNDLCYNKISNLFIKKKPENLIQINDLVCTKNHPIYSVNEKKFKRADEFQKGDYVYSIRKTKRTAEENSTSKKIAKDGSSMLYLQKEVGHRRDISQTKSSSRIENNMFTRMQTYTDVKSFKENQTKSKRKIRTRRQKRDVKKRTSNLQEKSQRFSLYAQCSEGSWFRERNWSNKTGKEIIRCIEESWNRKYNSGRNLESKRKRISLGLQSRHQNRRQKILCRSRWKNSLKQRNSAERFKERKETSINGLERSQIQERRNRRQFRKLCEENFVFNLEVENTNTYFANGILTHNCHRLIVERKKSMYSRFLKQINYNKQVIGLTATPYRNYCKWDNQTKQSRKTLDVLTEIGKPNSFWKSICYNIDISYLIDKGYLYKPEYRYFLNVDTSKLRLTKDGSDFTKKSLQEFDETNLSKVYELCLEAYKERNKIICFVETISAAEDLTARLIESGIYCDCISSHEEKSHNDKVLKDFKDAKISKMIVVNVNMLTEGYDAKECDAVILGSPTASLMRYVQRAGRCLRPAGQKPPIIYDYAQSSKRFDKVEDILLVPSLEGYKICTRDGRELTGYQQSYELEKDNFQKKKNSFSYQKHENQEFDFIRFDKMTITYIDGLKVSKRGNRYLKISVFIEDIQEDAEFMIMDKHIFNTMDYSNKVKHSIRFNNTIQYVRCSFDKESNFGFINDNVFYKE